MEIVSWIHGVVAGAFAAVILFAGICQIIRAIISIPHTYRMHKAWPAYASSNNDYIFNREDVKKCAELARKVHKLESRINGLCMRAGYLDPRSEHQRLLDRAVFYKGNHSAIKMAEAVDAEAAAEASMKLPNLRKECRVATIELAEHKMKMEADPAYQDAVKQRDAAWDKYMKLRNESIWH